MFCFKLDKSVTVTLDMLKKLHNSEWRSRVIFVPTEGQTSLFPCEVRDDLFLTCV